MPRQAIEMLLTDRQKGIIREALILLRERVRAQLAAEMREKGTLSADLNSLKMDISNEIDLMLPLFPELPFAQRRHA